jgi:hypothetical protein
MSNRDEFIKHGMKGLHLQINITADDGYSLGEAIQALVQNIGQGNKKGASITDEWGFSYDLIGEEIEA